MTNREVLCRQCGEPFVAWQGNGSDGYYATRCIECRHKGKERHVRELRCRGLDDIGRLAEGESDDLY